MTFRSRYLAIIATFAAISAAPAATVSFSSGGSFTTFEVSGGTSLVGGYLHAGYYGADPSALGLTALRDSFQTYATYAANSGGSGFFGNADFPVTPVGGAASQTIYLAVTDTLDIASATQIAVFTNLTDPDWQYPATDLGFTPSISMDDIVGGAAGSSILAGAEDTQFGGPSIALATIPEPGTSLLALLGVAGLIRRRR